MKDAFHSRHDLIQFCQMPMTDDADRNECHLILPGFLDRKTRSCQDPGDAAHHFPIFILFLIRQFLPWHQRFVELSSFIGFRSALPSGI